MNDLCKWRDNFRLWSFLICPVTNIAIARYTNNKKKLIHHLLHTQEAAERGGKMRLSSKSLPATVFSLWQFNCLGDEGMPATTVHSTWKLFPLSYRRRIMTFLFIFLPSGARLIRFLCTRANYINVETHLAGSTFYWRQSHAIGGSAASSHSPRPLTPNYQNMGKYDDRIGTTLEQNTLAPAASHRPSLPVRQPQPLFKPAPAQAPKTSPNVPQE